MSELGAIVRKLEARGYRVTPARREVVAAVLLQGGHFTVDDVSRRVRWAGRATLFRTMKLLQELGIVCRVLLEDGTLHYRLSGRGHHHHLVCVACGNVEDLDDCVVSDLVGQLATRSDYAIEGHWLELYGHCPSCRVETAVEATATR